MTFYHLSTDTIARRCRANKQPCPYGGHQDWDTLALTALDTQQTITMDRNDYTLTITPRKGSVKITSNIEGSNRHTIKTFGSKEARERAQQKKTARRIQRQTAHNNLDAWYADLTTNTTTTIEEKIDIALTDPIFKQKWDYYQLVKNPEKHTTGGADTAITKAALNNDTDTLNRLETEYRHNKARDTAIQHLKNITNEDKKLYNKFIENLTLDEKNFKRSNEFDLQDLYDYYAQLPTDTTPQRVTTPDLRAWVNDVELADLNPNFLTGTHTRDWDDNWINDDEADIDLIDEHQLNNWDSTTSSWDNSYDEDDEDDFEHEEFDF